MNWPFASSSLLVLCLGLTTFVPAAPAQEWGAYQGNERHNGYLPISVDPGRIMPAWTANFVAGLNPVTVGNGQVFVSSPTYFAAGDHLFALDARSGARMWTKNFGGIFSVNPPAYAYGNVYIQTGNHGSDTYLRAYDAQTGNIVFRSPHSAQWESYFAPTILDGNVYINGGYYGGMYSFHALSGNQNWFLGLPQYDDWTPAVDDRYAYAYVGEYTPGLYVANRQSGALEFMIPDPNFDWSGWSMNLVPVLGDDENVVAIHGGRLVSFDIVNRSIAWELASNFVGQPVVADGVIYAVNAGVLHARDEQSGSLLWQWEIASDNLIGRLFVTDNLAFVQTSSTTFAVDLASHDDVWSYPAAGHLTLGEGRLYIAAPTGVLTAFTVPEPSALVLLATGPAIVLIGRRRSRMPTSSRSTAP